MSAIISTPYLQIIVIERQEILRKTLLLYYLFLFGTVIVAKSDTLYHIKRKLIKSPLKFGAKLAVWQ